jgi:hypothetical protein
LTSCCGCAKLSNYRKGSRNLPSSRRKVDEDDFADGMLGYSSVAVNRSSRGDGLLDADFDDDYESVTDILSKNAESILN